ncbi:MAG: hypothetical protein L3J50_07865, partial [Emcibacter sp.]|nr:hypothetical protein [Emcibacter sp.]
MSKIRKIVGSTAMLTVAGLLVMNMAGTEVAKAAGDRAALVTINKNPYPSTYEPLPSTTTVIKNATVLTGTGAKLEGASVLMENGKIVGVGSDLIIPYGTEVIDGTGKWVTPGIIDVHSHLGVYASPNHKSLSDGNEATSPVTADMWAEHSVWPQDHGFSRAIAGGINSLQI